MMMIFVGNACSIRAAPLAATAFANASLLCSPTWTMMVEQRHDGIVMAYPISITQMDLS